jgi:hypothetical protein
MKGGSGKAHLKKTFSVQGGVCEWDMNAVKKSGKKLLQGDMCIFTAWTRFTLHDSIIAFYTVGHNYYHISVLPPFESNITRGNTRISNSCYQSSFHFKIVVEILK